MISIDIPMPENCQHCKLAGNEMCRKLKAANQPIVGGHYISLANRPDWCPLCPDRLGEVRERIKANISEYEKFKDEPKFKDARLNMTYQIEAWHKVLEWMKESEGNT